jgi:hypothetical protein
MPPNTLPPTAARPEIRFAPLIAAAPPTLVTIPSPRGGMTGPDTHQTSTGGCTFDLGAAVLAGDAPRNKVLAVVGEQIVPRPPEHRLRPDDGMVGVEPVPIVPDLDYPSPREVLDARAEDGRPALGVTTGRPLVERLA